MKAKTYFKRCRKLMQGIAVGALMLMSLSVLAEGKSAKIDATGAPHDVVSLVTDELLIFLKKNSGRLEADANGYYGDVRELLEPIIAFRYIARNVMGGRLWKASTAEQKDQFVEVFTKNLIETYVKGMASYAQYDVDVIPPAKNEKVPTHGKTSVLQKVKNAKGETKVAYTLRRKNPADSWKLVNVSLGSSNLGKSLRSQFSGAVAANLPQLKDGEKYTVQQIRSAIDLTIKNWGKA